MSRPGRSLFLVLVAAALARCSGGSGSSPVALQYGIGGHVSGVAGTGLVLHSSLGDDVAIAGDGAFVFPTKAVAGTTYAITVAVHPTAPWQTCTVSSGTGTVSSADVTNVAVSCATNTYAVGGTASGLAGTGLVLRNGSGPGADTISISSGGSFAFPARVPSGGSFSVSVEAQPSNPAQTCTVTGGSGTVGGGDVTTVSVNCNTDAFTIGGTITGLAGTGLVLENNGVEAASINVAAGTFAFATPIPSGQAYLVTVRTSPTSPWQTCSVASGSGTVGGANVTTVAVTCTTDAYAVGGSVVGLAGSGLVLRSGGQTVQVTGGSFAFPNPVASGATYAVTVEAQPASPSQTCQVVSGGSGVVAGATVTDVAVSCTTRLFRVGGTVAGLAGGGLEIDDVTAAGTETLAIAQSGSFEFVTSVASGQSFDVQVRTQPSDPTQTCVVSAGSGTVGGGDVTSVVVNCSTDAYAIGGTVSGLAGSGLVLRNNGSEEATVNANGAFAFATPIASGQGFDVTVETHPTGPWQTCSVASGSGSVTSAAVDTVIVTCTTNTYALGGSVSGLAGSGLVVRSGAQTLAVSANGPFQLTSPIASGSPYTVVVDSQPTGPTQTCAVDASTAAGTIQGSDVTDLSIACTTSSYSVGGSVSGLAGTLVLRNGGGDDLTIANDGPFTFATPVASGATYAVDVAVQPATQTCEVVGGAGTVGGGAVTSVVVNCTLNRYALGGSVTGLLGSGLVLANGADDVTVNGLDASFAFPTLVEVGAPYDVTVAQQPTSPWQTCAITDGSGTMGTSNASVAVACATDTFRLLANVTGVAGTGVTVTDGVQQLTLAADGAQAFTAPIASGTPYAVTIVSQPTDPWQTCAFDAAGGTGSVAGADVVVNLVCTTNTYSVGGDVAGMLQGGLVLRNNGSDDLAPTANGSFTFQTRVASGAGYSVTVEASPPTETCSVSSGTGTFTSSDVTSVAVSCTCSPGLADCNGVASDGCETDPTTDANSCGACGHVCAFSHASAGCVASTCVIGECAGSFGNCDGSDANGCETDIRTTENCGGCGIACPAGQSCVPGGGGRHCE